MYPRRSPAKGTSSEAGAALGLDTNGYSFGYAASWAVGKTDEEMRQCTRVVRNAASQIIDRL